MKLNLDEYYLKYFTGEFLNYLEKESYELFKERVKDK